MLLMSITLWMWVGLVVFRTAITFVFIYICVCVLYCNIWMIILGNSCSQPLVLKLHLLGKESSFPCHHDNRNESQLFAVF